jgi:hypothetical protein
MTRSIAWDKVTHADVLRAIQEYDRLGPEQFFSDVGHVPRRPFVQFATRPDTGSDCHFFSENIVAVDLLQDGARTWLDSSALTAPSRAGTVQGYVRVDALG